MVFEERIVRKAPFLVKHKSFALIAESDDEEDKRAFPIRNSPKKHVVTIAKNIASAATSKES